jgi:hypothetical protein
MIPPSPRSSTRRGSERTWGCRTIALALGLGLVASPAAAQSSCSAGRISEITYERLKPFGEEATSEEARLGWLFRGMNSIHVRTLPTVVRWELLFKEGDCLDDPLVLEESERALRSLPFLVEARLTSERLADGSHRVHVRTIDAWALSLGISFTVDDGFSFTGLSVNARNLFGTGTQVGLFRNQWRERLRVGVLARQPNLFGTRFDVTLHGGNTRSGTYLAQSLFRPYAGEFGKHALRQSFARRDDYFAYSVDPALGFTQTYVRFEAEEYEFTYQHRFGRTQGTRFVAGVGLSHEAIRFPFGDDGVRIVADNAFDDTAPAPANVIESVSGQVNDFSSTRLNFTVGLRDLDFLNLIGLDALRASQDVPSGLWLLLTVAPGFQEGGTAINDVLLRGRGRLGFVSGDLYVRFDADAQARGVLSAPEDGTDGWRDVLYQLDGNAYWSQGEGRQLFARAQLAGGSDLERPFQLTLGGRESVRGYQEDAYPGRQRLLLTVEERVGLPSMSTGFADVGVVAFADAGRIWAGDVPFGETPGWKAGIGAGLRIGLPAGAPSVLRVDFGLPLTGDRESRGTVFRVYGELLGILQRRGWPTQIERSRWHGVDANLTTRPVNPLAGN